MCVLGGGGGGGGGWGGREGICDEYSIDIMG